MVGLLVKDNIQRKWLPGTNGCSTTQDNVKRVSEQDLMNRGKPLDLVKKLRISNWSKPLDFVNKTTHLNNAF